MVRSAVGDPTQHVPGEAGFEWPPKAASSDAELFVNEPAEGSAAATAPPGEPPASDVDALRRKILAKSATRAEKPPAAAPQRSRRSALRWPVMHARTWFVRGGLFVLVAAVVLQAAYIFQLRSRAVSAPAATVDAGAVLPQRTPSVALPSRSPVVPPPPRAAEPAGAKTPMARGGRLTIKSDPPGAQVLIDGRSYGVTPLALGNVTPGDRHVVIRHGAQEARHKVRIEQGTAASLVVPLAAASGQAGWLSSASAIELDLFENGALIGTSRSRQLMLPAGRHTIELVNEQTGFRRTEDVSIEAGKVTTLKVVLPLGVIHLNATPWADVWIDGKAVGQTPLGNHSIPIGVHEIVFRHPVLGERVLSTVVRADAAARLSADMRRGPGDRQ